MRLNDNFRQEKWAFFHTRQDALKHFSFATRTIHQLDKVNVSQVNIAAFMYKTAPYEILFSF